MRSRIIPAATLVVAAFCIASTLRSAESWPRFRGPNGAGVAKSPETPTKLGTENLAWKTVVPHGVSSPCIWGDRIFLSGHNAEQRELLTICLDAHSARLLWEQRSVLQEVPSTHVAGSPAAPTIATDGERVFVYFGLIGLVCYDLEGEQIWRKELSVPHNRHGAGASPIVMDELLLLVCDQGDLFRPMGSYFLALNKFDGSEVWKKDRPLAGAGWSTPIIWTRADRREVVVLGHRLIGYDGDSGEERWWVDGLMDFALSTPVLGDGLLFAVTAAGGFESETRIKLPAFSELAELHDQNRDGLLIQDELPSEMLFYKGDTTGLPGDGVTAREALAMFDGDKSGSVDRQEWDRSIEFWNRMQNTLVAIRPGGRGDVTKSHVVWRSDRHLPEVPSPLYFDGHLYLLKNGGVVSCLKAESGKLVYRKRLGAAGNYFASPVASAGKIYLASDRGVVTIVQAGQHAQVISRNDLGEQIVATPAIAHDRIYVRTNKHLYCFE